VAFNVIVCVPNLEVSKVLSASINGVTSPSTLSDAFT